MYRVGLWLVKLKNLTLTHITRPLKPQNSTCGPHKISLELVNLSKSNKLNFYGCITTRLYFLSILGLKCIAENKMHYTQESVPGAYFQSCINRYK